MSGPPVGARPGTTIATTFRLLALAWGAAVASFPLTDNSFLTHLATGRLILDTGRVPTVDPYTFTASGTAWTVQSWLPSVVAAGAERLAGAAGLHAVVLVLAMAGAGLLWSLTEACPSLVPRIAIVFGSLFVVTGSWGERPYMVGVVGLGLVLLALDDRLPPWTLVPVLWLWANSHGSFPMALALVVLVAVGRRLDGDDLGVTVRVGVAVAAGTVAAVISPLGLRVLSFPFTALSRAGVLSEIVEWQPPTFRSLDQRLFLVLVVVALLGLVRRPRWADALPTVVFVAASVVAQRNMVMAVMVFAPTIARSAPTFGSLRTDARPRLVRAYTAVGAAALVLAVVHTLTSPFGELGGYPARAVAWIDTTSLADDRTATQDIVGNFLTVLDGAEAGVFVDDRVDMLPEGVVDDGLALLRGRPEWGAVLDEWSITAVIWRRTDPLGSLLASDPAWRIRYSDTTWIVACRRDACR